MMRRRERRDRQAGMSLNLCKRQKAPEVSAFSEETYCAAVGWGIGAIMGPQRGRQAGDGSEGQVLGAVPGQCWKSHGNAGLRGPGPEGALGQGQRALRQLGAIKASCCCGGLAGLQVSYSSGTAASQRNCNFLVADVYQHSRGKGYAFSVIP